MIILGFMLPRASWQGLLRPVRFPSLLKQKRFLTLHLSLSAVCSPADVLKSRVMSQVRYLHSFSRRFLFSSPRPVA